MADTDGPASGAALRPLGRVPHFRAPKTADLVAREIRNQIVSGRLTAGQLLPAEAPLTRQLGVSRTALREAYRILETEGLIRVRRGALGGAVVQPPTAEVATRSAGLLLQYLGTTVSDVYDARTALEVPAVTSLARARRPADVETLRASADEATRTLDDPSASPPLHSSFHEALMRLAGNQTLTLFWTMTDQIITTANQSFLSHSPAEVAVRDVHRAQRAHLKVIDLIVEGNVTEAEALWTEHLGETASMIHRETGPMRVIDLLSGGSGAGTDRPAGD